MDDLWHHYSFGETFYSFSLGTKNWGFGMKTIIKLATLLVPLSLLLFFTKWFHLTPYAFIKKYMVISCLKVQEEIILNYTTYKTNSTRLCLLGLAYHVGRLLLRHATQRCVLALLRNNSRCARASCCAYVAAALYG
jgi:hypothetical protein